jgi:ribosomal subunit interface protein
MNVLIEAPFDITNNNKKAIEEQTKELSVYNQGITNVDIYFREDDGNESDVILAQVQVRLPGPEVFASETDQNYMKAFSLALNKVERQLRKRKSMNQDRHNPIPDIQ